MRFIDFSTPWLIEPNAARRYLRVYADVLARREAGAALDTAELEAQGVTLGAANKPSTQGKVGVVPIEGPIVKHADLMDAVSGLTSYEGIRNQLAQMQADDSISSIVLDINSPGGQMAGYFGCADYIRNGVTKPITAFSDGSMCSAAYALACACDEVVLSKSAMAGSIGAIFGLVDDTKQQAMMGLKEIKFVSSVSPNKNLDPQTDAGAAQYQQLVDDAGNEFVALVAKMRGVSVSTVKSDFGKGGVMMGKRAAQAGLADRVGTLDNVINDLAAGKLPQRNKSAASAATGARNMGALENLRARINAAFDSHDVETDDLPPAVAAPGANAGMQSQSGQVLFDGLTQEQVRARLAEADALKAAQKDLLASQKAAALEAFTAKYEGRLVPVAMEQATLMFAAAQDNPALLPNVEAFAEAMATASPGAGPAAPNATAGERPNPDAAERGEAEQARMATLAMTEGGRAVLARSEAGKAYMAANGITV